MILNANCKLNIEATPSEAFQLLLQSLDMEWCMEDRKYFTVPDSEWDNELRVKEVVNGHDEAVDDRGELFHALRKLATLIYPNLSFRNEYD